MMKIGILSDSHIRDGLSVSASAKYTKIITVLTKLFQDVDHIIHAGDVVSERLVADLGAIATTSVVRGNCDRSQKWPKILRLRLLNVPIVVAHEPELYFELDPKPRVFIHGHTHYPRIYETPENCLVINPGSLTKPRKSPYLIKNFDNGQGPRPTVAFLTIEKDNVAAFIKKL